MGVKTAHRKCGVFSRKAPFLGEDRSGEAGRVAPRIGISLRRHGDETKGSVGLIGPITAGRKPDFAKPTSRPRLWYAEQ
jgi:hypothetical protein